MGSRWFAMRGWWLWLLIAVMMLCGADAVNQGSRGEPAARQAITMPAGLRAAYVATVQAEAGAGYAVQAGAAGLVADNPAQGLEIGFSEEGLELEARGMRATLRPSRFGCAGALREVQRALPKQGEGRVEYRREGFVEWYVNGPFGVEQGFTVSEPPGCGSAGGGEILVELSLGKELSAELAEDGKQVDLRNAEDERVLRYSELYATDATGKALPAQLRVIGGEVSIRVEAAGAAYPVVIDPLIWKEKGTLLPDSGVAAKYAGRAVALAGDTAIVGACQDDDKGQDAGAAYVFVRSGAGWSKQQKLVASDGAAGDCFGIAVALADDTALIGSTDGESHLAGAAYVFVRSGATWTQQQKLVASDGVAGDDLGTSVALAGETALIGALHAGSATKGPNTGAAYVFVRSGATWTQQQKLVSSDGAQYDIFGASVALAGETALVGAPYADTKVKDEGAAYVFVRSGVTWIEQQKLVSNDGSMTDLFGSSVSLSNNTALIGTRSGVVTAYVFVRSGVTWTEQQKLLPSDGALNEGFGSSVALSGDTALIGARDADDKGQDAGAAYVFIRSGASWTEQKKLLASDGATGDNFGFSVALDGDSALIWAPFAVSNAQPTGAVYIFVRGLSTGDTCTTSTTCVSGLCFGGVCVDPTDACMNATTGTPCDDGNLCTQQDTCQGGVCVGENPVVCPDPPAQDCALAICLPATGACGTAPKLDGAPCPGGVCIAGGCLPDATSTSSTSGAGSTAGAGGAGGTSPSPSTTATSTSTTGTTASSVGSGGAPAEPGEIHLHGGACAYTTAPAPSSVILTLLLPLLLAARKLRARSPRRHKRHAPRLPLRPPHRDLRPRRHHRSPTRRGTVKLPSRKDPPGGAPGLSPITNA